MLLYLFFFFFKQKTAYEVRISDWSSDVCSSDLAEQALEQALQQRAEYAKSGLVILVGAGPGDPGLLTLSGLRALNRADIILYDRLVSPEILRLAQIGRASCRERVCQYV